MDFRTLAPSRVVWLPTGKVAYGSGKFVFQTPAAAYSRRLNHRFGNDTRDIVLRPSNAEFVEFLRSIDASAAAADVPQTRGLQQREAVTLSGELQLTAFENETAWFSKEDELVGRAPPPGEGVCACLLEVAGVWVSAASWGIKLKVLEVKEMAHGVHGVHGVHSGWAFREAPTMTPMTPVTPTASLWAFREESEKAEEADYK